MLIKDTVQREVFEGQNFHGLLPRANLQIKFSGIQGLRSPFSFRLKRVHLREWPKVNLSIRMFHCNI